MEDKGLVDAVCADYTSAPLSPVEKALFKYLEKVNDAPATVGPDDVEAAKAAGCTDEMLYEAATVCAIFNFFNRWIDATGVPDVPGRFFEERLEQHGDHGYTP